MIIGPIIIGPIIIGPIIIGPIIRSKHEDHKIITSVFSRECNEY